MDNRSDRAADWVVLGLCVAVLVMCLTGCATTVDPNYAVRIEAQASVERAQAEVEKARAAAEAARWAAVARVAESATDPASRQIAVLALALGGSRSVEMPRQPAPMPALPVTDADRALQWAQVFAGPLTNIAAGYFGYRLGVTQSNNAADTTIASYNTFGSIANSGLATSGSIAGAAFGAAGSIAGYIQAPQPNLTLSGAGVIGPGSYVGPYSGGNSGNSGIIGSENHSPKPVSTTTTTTSTCTASTGC
jgi:hypothetical protein